MVYWSLSLQLLGQEYTNSWCMRASCSLCVCVGFFRIGSMQVRLAHSGGTPKLCSNPHLNFEFICIITVKGFFFLCYSWITDPFPDTKYNKNLHLRSQCTVTFKYARVVLIRQTLVLYHHIINIGHFQFWSSYFYECVNSAAAAPRVSWSSSIDCLGNPEYYICCYSWLVYPIFQVWRHKEISDVHIWCFNKVFKSLHIVLRYW